MTMGARLQTQATGSERVPLQQRVFVALKEMIEQGRLRPGEVLLEVKVAHSFGISRSPARFALEALSEAQLVREASGRGYVVNGRVKTLGEGKVAELDTLQLSLSPQWERMYGQLEQELFTRVLFGTVRITEERLAAHFGVSRTVVRDVLGRMHSLGLVVKDRLGHWIAKRVTPARIQHLFELRILLEPEALRQAIPLLPRAQLLEARDRIHHVLHHFPAEIAAIDRAETDLHIDLLSICPNQEITLALKRTHLLFAPTRYLADPYLEVPKEVLGRAFDEHARIIDQLCQGDAEQAVASLQDHLRRAHRRWRRRFEMADSMTQAELPSYLTHVPEKD